ncbi:hypothetical protein GGI02_003715 [Coemansia sp. RSA 2322]|nr:hypothetical protein GGI02_003715 [Coemansia sp. RSA 2322]
MTDENSAYTPKAARVRVTYGSQPPKSSPAYMRANRSPVHLSSSKDISSLVLNPLPCIAAAEVLDAGAEAPHAKTSLRLATPKRKNARLGDMSSSEDEDEDDRQQQQPKKRLVQTSLQLGTCRKSTGHLNSSVTLDKMFPAINESSSLPSQLAGTKAGTIARKQQPKAAVVGGPRKEQTFLDFGQKPLAPVPCSECGMTYQRGKDEDEALHDKFHRSWLRQEARLLVWLPGLSNGDEGSAETVALPSQLAKLHGVDRPAKAAATATIRVVSSQESSRRELQRALEILNIANEHLGAVRVEVADMALRQRKIFLYTTQRGQVLGCVLAELISSAQRVVPPSDATSSALDVADDACRAVCGISRVWVVPSARRCGVASQLIDAVHKRFVYGCAIDTASVAFTQPTSDGRALAERVFGRRDFLVYVED